MTRFYQNLLGKRAGLKGPLPKAEALAAADWQRLQRRHVIRRADRVRHPTWNTEPRRLLC